MKLYVVNNYWKNNTMAVDEIEVVEKPKSYSVADKDREKAHYASRILKENIGCMDSYNYYSVGKTAQEAIDVYKRYCKDKIEYLQKELGSMERRLSQLEKLERGEDD